MALSSGSKDLDDRIQELAPRMMDEARKDPESVIVQDPWFSPLDWSPKKKKAERAGVAGCARHSLAEMVLGLDETQKTFTSQHDRSHTSKPNCTALIQVGVARLPFVSFERTRLDNTASLLPFRKLPNMDSLFSNSTLTNLILHHGFSSYKLPHKDGEKSTVASPPSKTFVKYAADGVLTSPGGEAKEARAVGGSWFRECGG